jgi:hypothetical protein
LSGGRTKADQDFRLYRFQFSVKPGTARIYLRVSGLLVDASLAALRWSPFEVLHYIGDVNIRPVDASLAQCLVQNFARRPHEGAACHILLVTGLFPDKHDFGFGRTFSKNRLGSILPEIASLAITGCASEAGECLRLQRRHRRLFASLRLSWAVLDQ